MAGSDYRARATAGIATTFTAAQSQHATFVNTLASRQLERHETRIQGVLTR